MEEQSHINLESLKAVKNLKSKFEQLAHVASPARAGSGINQDDFLLAPATSPRPRASSNSYLNTNHTESAHQLRPSSSSSDLITPLKRAPPPPPPPRGSKSIRSPSPSVSPAASPLTRPVPIPQSLAANPFSLNSQPSDAEPTPRSVSSLKGRFDNPPSSIKLHSPRQSISESYPEPPAYVAPKPAIPPRPTALLAPSRTVSQDSYTEKARRSPFSDDEHSTGSESSPSSTTSPPAVPPRKFQHERPPSHPHRSTRELSDSSTESDIRPSTRPSSMAIPPPPPRRPVSSISPSGDLISLSPPPQPGPAISVAPPPPLPVRRSMLLTQPLPPRRIPSRTQQPAVFIANSNGVLYDSPTQSPVERRAVGTSKLPPPPTRTIGLGEKLPAARRPTSPSSNEDSSDEEDQKAQTMDSLPDSSTSSRRPPTLSFRDGLSTEPRIHVHAHTGCVLASGTHVVVAHGHHMKIYDLSTSDIPLYSLDTKDIGAKDAKITCMELRPCDSNLDRGFLLWVGTKEGHIIELDIRSGVALGIKHSAHIHPITHMFRYGRSMVTLDESGKAFVFAPDMVNTYEVSLAGTQPRVVRTTEKQDFVRLFGGKLWTAARTEHHGFASAQKMPIIRVYDLFNPGSAGRSLLPNEHVGAVTSAAMLPSHPDMVYVGHEEGFITIWALETEDGWPKCIEAVKVSTSGVLSLEGVNNRLWAGSRNGMISAYDVLHKPWIMTNCWTAHPGLPVMKLMVNYYAIERTGRLCVVSIGRDEQLRLWDGLLGLDWVDKELSKSEPAFSSFREITALVVSWNCDSARPDSLNDDPINREFFHEVLSSVSPPPDLISFGFQEVIDLESRRMVAKNVLLGGKKKPEDALSDKVTGAYKRWYDRLIIAVRSSMRDVEYTVIHTESLVGLFSCIFVKSSERLQFTDVSVTTIKRGMGGMYGNKGGIVARCVIGDSSLCLINCHLAAGQNAVRTRNADVAGILEDRAVFSPSDHQLAYVGGGDGSMVLDHEFVLFNGDMNYRIDHRRDAIITAIRSGDLSSLLPHDQLLREIKFNRGCRLRGFSEGPLLFAPTYKYDPRSNEYDTSEKRRSPAWCDRVLFRSHVGGRIRQLHYRRYEANVSDHRPISAAFALTVKSLQPEAREKHKAVVETAWIKEQTRLLVAAKEFYVRQALM